MNYKMVLNTLGKVMLIGVIILILPLLVSIIYSENLELSFIVPIIILLVLSIPCLLVKPKDKMIYATHGHTYNEDNLPPLKKGDVLLCGHTHVAKCTEHDDYVYMNPGSASIPKENTHRGYMTLFNGVFTWKDFEGNTIMTFTI